MCRVLYFLNTLRNIAITYISYNEGKKMFILMHPVAHTHLMTAQEQFDLFFDDVKGIYGNRSTSWLSSPPFA
jgi:hypothetical protein